MTSEQAESKCKLDLLTRLVSNRADRVNRSVRWYRGRHYATTMSTVFLSGTITVLAGWKPSLDADASNAILLLGAVSTVVSAWGAFFSSKESWILHAATLAKLRALQAKIRYSSCGSLNTSPDESTPLNALFARYEEILAELNDGQHALWSASNESISSHSP